MASAREPVGIDLGTTGGDWLFKQGDLLLGPVPARVLVDKLYKGEIDAQTPVAREGQDDFVPIEQVDFFKVHARKAQVKVKVDQDTVNMRMQEKRKRFTKVGAFVVLGVVLLAGGAAGATWLAIHKPWRKADTADLISINVEAPAISLAPVKKDDEVAIALPSPKAPGAKHHHPGHRAPHPGANPPQPASPDGMVSSPQFDKAAISQIAQQKATSVYPCIMAEARAHPPVEPVHLPLEFTVQNDGRVGKIWVDNHDYGKGTPLYACLIKKLRTWRFPHYQGEQANVKLNFNWGRKN